MSCIVQVMDTIEYMRHADQSNALLVTKSFQVGTFDYICLLILNCTIPRARTADRGIARARRHDRARKRLREGRALPVAAGGGTIESARADSSIRPLRAHLPSSPRLVRLVSHLPRASPRYSHRPSARTRRRRIVLLAMLWSNWKFVVVRVAPR